MFDVSYKHCLGEQTEVTPNGVTEVVLTSPHGRVTVAPNSRILTTYQGDHTVFIEHGAKWIVLDLTNDAVDQLIDALVLSRSGNLVGEYDPIDVSFKGFDSSDEPKVVRYLYEPDPDEPDELKNRFVMPFEIGELRDLVAEQADLHEEDIIQFNVPLA